ncbi:protein kinase family protein [Acetobacterium tundrae]|uniref:Protein kinase n=1 Tax=Acetobacterium tundrae TaxID=132932 RepID=A0ABR6WNH7_9FIRM|nr:protein kinase family protein [Acetobacterium tundrae]MBC3797962.1 protein kinase [Acetobacterium tundrae]
MVEVSSTIKGALSLFDYRLSDALGSGRFGSCYLISQYDKFFVFKIFNSNDVKRFKRKLVLEGKYLKSINHPAIPKLIRVIDTDGIYGLIMERMSGDSLEDLLNQGYPFSKKEIFLIIKQLIDVMEYLYSLKISHRDIKASNILWKNNKISLVDFGSARDLSILSCRFNPDFWGMGDVFMRLALSSQEMTFSHHDFYIDDLNLDSQEKIIVKRLLHIEQPYDNIQDLKRDFVYGFSIDQNNEQKIIN